MSGAAMKKKLEKLWPSAEVAVRFKNRLEIRVKPEELPAMLGVLRTGALEHMSNLTCVDWLEDGEMELIYNLWSYENKTHAVVKSRVSRKNPVVPTVMDVWPQAQAYEREIHEMFGVEFTGNPDLSPLFLHDWLDVPPLRKDFDTVEYCKRAYNAVEPGRGS